MAHSQKLAISELFFTHSKIKVGGRMTKFAHANTRKQIYLGLGDFLG